MGEVLACLEKHGLRVKKSKCTFMQDSVENLGHQIDSSGLHTMPDKLNAIIKAPETTTVQELHLFLGLLNYYASCSRTPGGSGLRSVSTPAGKGTPHFLSCLVHLIHLYLSGWLLMHLPTKSDIIPDDPLPMPLANCHKMSGIMHNLRKKLLSSSLGSRNAISIVMGD